MAIQLRDLEWQLRRLETLRRVVGNRIVSEAGLQRGRLPILEYIQHHEGTSQKEVADVLHITPASVAITGRRMENDGLLTRTPDEQDRRITRMYTTALGREKAAHCQALLEASTRRMFAGFQPEELGTLHAMLERLFANLSGKEYLNFSFFPMNMAENDTEQEDPHA